MPPLPPPIPTSGTRRCLRAGFPIQGLSLPYEWKDVLGGLTVAGGLLLCTCQGRGAGETGGTDPSRSGCAPAPISSLVVSVKAAPYDAKGDGITDDTAALQKAIDAVGGTGVTAKECWGDGFMVANATDVTLCHVTADHNRRQGLTITGGNGVVVRDSRFANTSGAIPEDGLDIEPNSGQTVHDVLITGCTFANNAGDGIENGVPGSLTGKAFISSVVIEGNTLTGNGVGSLNGTPRSGIEVTNTSGHVLRNNTIQGNVGCGIYLRNGATGMTVTRNAVMQNGLNGILEYLSSGNTISDNTLSGNGVPP